MHTAKGRIFELRLEHGQQLAWISCPQTLIPAPGQYLLAGDASDSPLPVPLFYTDFGAEGFMAVLPDAHSWHPGQELVLRGPLGRGFALPTSARKIALIAFDDQPVRLRGLIPPALKRGAAVVVISNFEVWNLPDEVEVQPLPELSEVLRWADYCAFDVARENLLPLSEMLDGSKQSRMGNDAQILIRTSIPCGGMAECGICAVSLKSGWKLACKDGPVFDWNELRG